MGRLGIVNGCNNYFHSTERLWSMVVLSPQEPVCWMATPPKVLGVMVADKSTFTGSGESAGNGVEVST